jgi:organic hydroperoxide reductase OsmC/OhrA
LKPFPHHYAVTASAAVRGSVELRSEGVPPLASAPPVEFDGPGDAWSPESLLVAAVVDCFVLTFRSLARSSSLEWTQIRGEAEGTLDRVEQVSRFVSLRIRADLQLPASADPEKGRRLLEMATYTQLRFRDEARTRRLAATDVMAQRERYGDNVILEAPSLQKHLSGSVKVARDGDHVQLAP